MLGVRRGWTRWLMGPLQKGSLVGRAGSRAHSQGRSLGTDHGLSVSFSLEGGWTVVKRKKEERHQERREGKGTKEELCKVKHSSLCFRAPSLRTGKSFPCKSSELRGSSQFCGSRAFVELDSAHAGSRHQRCPFSGRALSGPRISKRSSRSGTNAAREGEEGGNV